MADDTIKLVVTIDKRQAEQALKQLTDSVDKTAKSTEAGFFKAGLAVQGVVGIAGALKDAFLELAKSAAAAFQAIVAESIDLASNMEAAKITFTNIFDGDEAGAEAFLGRLNDLALQLGTKGSALTGFARSILPDTENIEQFERLTRAAVTLERSDPDKTIDDVRFAIEEALSGNFVSLQQRFDLPKDSIRRIKELQGELGKVEGIIVGLEEEFQRTGQSLESFSDTYATTLSRIDSRFDALKVKLGEPALEALKEEFSALDETLKENADDLGLFAGHIGDMVAAVVDFVGSGLNDFIKDLDFEKLDELGTSLQEGLAAAELLLDVLFELPEGDGAVQSLLQAVEKLTEALETTARKAVVARMSLVTAFHSATALFRIKRGDAVGALEAFRAAQEAASPEQLTKSIEDAEEAHERYEKRIKSIDRTTRERRNSLTLDTEGALDNVNAHQKAKQALKEAEEAAKSRGDAEAAIEAKQAKNEKERGQRLADLEKKTGERRFDAAVKNAQRREDLARNNEKAVADIFRKNSERIEEAAEDLTEDEADIYRDHARDREQIERDAARDRVEVERNYRQDLKRIQETFLQSAGEAERNNDAQSFLRAVRARDQQIEAAKGERDTGLEGVDRNAQEQRAALKLELDQELEDARITNARKLEDFQGRLQRELEAQAMKNAEAFEQQAINEQRQAEQRALNEQREFEAFELNEARKLEKLNESLAKQFEALRAAKEKEIELVKEAEIQKALAIAEAAGKRRKREEAEEREFRKLTEGPNARRIEGLEGFAAGGAVGAGQSAVVGEAGPEIFTAPANGMIIPNQTMFSPPSPTAGLGSSVNNSRSLSVENVGINPGDAMLSQMVRNEISRYLELLG